MTTSEDAIRRTRSLQLLHSSQLSVKTLERVRDRHMLSAWRAGVTLRSIADVLGLSHATVRIRIHELERQESRQAA